MENLKKSIFIILIFSFAFLATGCIKFNTGKKQPVIDGGVFKTINHGATWQQKSLIATTKGKPDSFGDVNAASLVIDPSDSRAVYFGSVDRGLYYTYDKGENWHFASDLGNTTIRSIAIDYNNKCAIYAAVGNRVMKTTDCSRSWQQIYKTDNTKTLVDAVSVDHFDNNIIYIGLSNGDILRSASQGAGWQIVNIDNRLNDRITDIMVDPNDSRTVYVLTNKKGVFIIKNEGRSWEEFSELNNALKEAKIGLNMISFTASKTSQGFMLAATTAGIMRSEDSGKTWEKINTILPQKSSTINHLAVNDKNINEIYYITSTTFYRSVDGGENWSPYNLPSARPGKVIALDPIETNVLYLGVLRIKK